MENIDAIKINFNQDQLFVLNLCLAFLMYGVALDIRLGDFWRIFRQPKAPLVGLSSQLLFLPVLTLGVILLLQPPASVALGMMLVGVCPGGNVSNFMVHLAKGNSALSVLMTSITTLGAAITVPLYFRFWSGFIPGTEALASLISVDIFDMVRTIFLIILVPLFLGMVTRERFPLTTERVKRPVGILSMLIFLAFVVFGIAGNLDLLGNAVFGPIFFFVFVHNTLALLLGFSYARLAGLSAFNTRAITIETGIQNSGLALVLIFNFFEGLGGMALIAAWWGIWHLISGFAVATFFGRRAVERV
ncbi:MAG: bile acid:sodium symporter family protein [Bacteroidota bacterium]